MMIGGGGGGVVVPPGGGVVVPPGGDAVVSTKLSIGLYDKEIWQCISKLFSKLYYLEL
jgi:hypothetical protein